MSAIRFAVIAALCLASAAHAAKPAPAEDPAVETTRQAGTTILGERESDQGLYLTPWKEEHADNIDPPPGLLDVPPAPVDPRAFSRQVRDAATLAAYRREQSR